MLSGSYFVNKLLIDEHGRVKIKLSRGPFFLRLNHVERQAHIASACEGSRECCTGQVRATWSPIYMLDTGWSRTKELVRSMSSAARLAQILFENALCLLRLSCMTLPGILTTTKKHQGRHRNSTKPLLTIPRRNALAASRTAGTNDLEVVGSIADILLDKKNSHLTNKRTQQAGLNSCYG